MRKSNFFLGFIAILLLLFGLMFIHASLTAEKETSLLREKGEMVSQLELTDLCLFTEASYTRQLTQADLHTPFQDSPSSLEHFPSGSLVRPPMMLRNGHRGGKPLQPKTQEGPLTTHDLPAQGRHLKDFK